MAVSPRAASLTGFRARLSVTIFPGGPREFPPFPLQSTQLGSLIPIAHTQTSGTQPTAPVPNTQTRHTPRTILGALCS